MKKTALILAGILLCTTLAACTEPGSGKTDTTAQTEVATDPVTETSADTQPEHIHTATGAWERNAKEHWQVCEDGEKLNVAGHTFDVESICTVCKSMVDMTDEGEAYVNTYDEQDNLIRYTYFGADGSVISEIFTEYATDAEGNYYEKKSTEYDYANSSIYIGEYNEYEDQTARTITDLDGNVQQKDRFEREYNDDGKAIWEKFYTDDVLVMEITGYKTYTDGEYSVRFPESVIEYYEDGSKLVTEYNDQGEVGKETTYKADGTVEAALNYVYEYDADGNYKHIKTYEGEQLVKDAEYAISADGWSYMAKETEYHTDGTKTVREYNENDELIGESKYDAEGNLI